MATIQYLTTVQFAFGAIGQTPAELTRLNIRKPLIVTDKGVRAAGLLDKLLAVINAESVTIFDDTPGNPTEDAVIAATDRYHSGVCDSIIALGGGSAIDLGKAVAILATHPGPLQQYAVVEGGASRITASVAPLVAIPTTAGTGSEVGRGSLIVMRSGLKLGLLSPHLLPKVAICDPELTFKLPPQLTAATGLDAIAHCIETYLSPAINPPAEAIALDGLRRAIRHVERATTDGQDRDARWNMMMAAMEGAMAFQKGLGAVHALSHPLGSIDSLRLHHGMLNAVLLPAVLRFNAPVVGDKIAVLAEVMGLAGDQTPDMAISQLNQRLGLAGGLRAMGVPEAILPKIAAQAMRDHCHATNPRVATEQDYLAMLQASY